MAHTSITSNSKPVWIHLYNLGLKGQGPKGVKGIVHTPHTLEGLWKSQGFGAIMHALRICKGIP